MIRATTIVRTALASVFFASVFTACELDGKHDGQPFHFSSSSLSSESILPGTWYLEAEDGSSWYIHFGEDGNWKITDDAEGTARRVFGSFSTSGDEYSGDMTNPRVGDGTISGKVLSETTLDLDFCEHWHSPYKHIIYSGTKQ